jgi:hypothetical protein
MRKDDEGLEQVVLEVLARRWRVDLGSNSTK